jgi:hypothetical protein
MRSASLVVPTALPLGRPSRGTECQAPSSNRVIAHEGCEASIAFRRIASVRRSLVARAASSAAMTSRARSIAATSRRCAYIVGQRCLRDARLAYRNRRESDADDDGWSASQTERTRHGVEVSNEGGFGSVATRCKCLFRAPNEPQTPQKFPVLDGTRRNNSR